MMDATRLRIAVLIRKFSFHAGGAERYAAELVRHLSATHDIHVFAQDLEADLPGVTLHKVPLLCRRPRWINQIFFSAWTRLHTRHGFDLVHSHDNVAHGDVQTVHVYPLSHLWFHEAKTWSQRAWRWLTLLISPRLLTYWWLERLRLAPRRGRWVVAVSEPVRQVLQQLANINPTLAVLTPGIAGTHPTNALQQRQAQDVLGLPPNTTWLLWIGNNVTKKGLPGLIEALSRLPDHVGLMLAGTSRPKTEWQRLAEQCGVRHRIVDIGVRDDIQTAYQACDLLVHPTLEDTYGMVVLEAMSHGRPVVVSDARYCGIAADLVHDQDACILRDPLDVTTLVNVIQHALLPPNQARLSAAALAWSEQRLWPKVAQLQDTIYRQALKARDDA